MSRWAYRKLVPRWAEIGARSPAVSRVLSAAVGLWRSAYGIARWNRLAAIDVISRGLGVSRLRASAIYLRSEISTARSQVDFAILEGRSPAAMADWAVGHCGAENVGNLRSALAEEAPLVLLVASFAPHYFGLVTEELVRLVARRVAILQPSQALEPLREIGFYEKLSAAGGQQIDTIAADGPSALLQAMRALARGSAVALRIDSVPTRTGNFILSRMLDRQAAFPASVLLIGRAAGAVFLPLFVFRRGNGFVTSFGVPVRVGRKPPNAELVEAATLIDKQIEAALISDASTYSAWYSVYERMRLAEELLEATADHSDG